MVISIVKKDSRYGLKNAKNNKIILEPIYLSIDNFSENLAVIKKLDENEDIIYNFIDDNEAKFFSEEWFEYAERFSCGFSKVKHLGKYKYLSKKGDFLKLKNEYLTISSFKKGVAEVKNINYETKYIDVKGKELNTILYKKIGNSYGDIIVITNNNKIVQIRSSKIIVNTIEEFENEIPYEKLPKTITEKFIRKIRRIKKDMKIK